MYVQIYMQHRCYLELHNYPTYIMYIYVCVHAVHSECMYVHIHTYFYKHKNIPYTHIHCMNVSAYNIQSLVCVQ